MIRVLHIDDERSDCELVREFLGRIDESIKVESVTSADVALERIEKNEYDCFLSDFQMPGTDGLSLLKLIRQRDKDIPFIFLTGQGNEQFAEEAFNNGATDYYSKNTGFALYNRLANSIRRVVAGHKEMRRRIRFEHALRAILQVTSSDTGLEYFESLLVNLSDAVSVKFGFIAEKQEDMLTTISFYANGQPLENVSYKIEGTPCEVALKEGVCYFPENAQELFPGDAYLRDQDIESYCAFRLEDRNGNAQGLIGLMHSEGMKDRDFILSLVRIFAARASSEMERLHILTALEESRELYRTVFNTVDDCIVIHDLEPLQVLDVNQAVLDLTGYSYEEALNVRADVGSTEEEKKKALRTVIDNMTRVAAGEDMRVSWPLRTKSGEIVEIVVDLKRIVQGGKTRIVAISRPKN